MKELVSYESNDGNIVTVFRTKNIGSFSYYLGYRHVTSKEYTIIQDGGLFLYQVPNFWGDIIWTKDVSQFHTYELSKIMSLFKKAVKAIKKGVKIKPNEQNRSK